MQNYYLPKKVKILQVIKEAPGIKTFILNYRPRFNPGQFFMVGIQGIGESPISVSGSVNGKACFTIKEAGVVTEKLHRLKGGDFLEARGPFGNGFALDALKNRDILVIVGGLGLAPLRPLINYALQFRKDFKKIFILYGARTPRDILFKRDLKSWGKRKDINLLLTVDNPDCGWQEGRGVVTGLLKKIKIVPQDTAAIVCGPPIMMRYAVYNLLKMGLSSSGINLSLERQMKCGIGKCGHCYLGEKFVCLDGPVFRYSDLVKLRPEVEL